ncbi:MAG: hemerythrin domain-containing protein [Kiloniellaceae bacterium]
MRAAGKPRTRIEPTEPALLRDPLNFFFAEHFRQRTLCNLIEEMTHAEILDEETVSGVLEFLRHDMELHVQDEEQSLFPLMRCRCPPEDEIERVLSALSAEHAGDRHLAELMISGLEAVLAEGRPVGSETGLREAMVDFARNERRHLALENSVLLPLARLRLTAKDLAEMSASMIERRRATSPSKATKT